MLCCVLSHGVVLSDKVVYKVPRCAVPYSATLKAYIVDLSSAIRMEWCSRAVNVDSEM